QDLDKANAEFAEGVRKQAENERLRRMNRLAAPQSAAASPAPADRAVGGRFLTEEMAAGIDARQGFESVAQAGYVGEMFQYNIATPVTLARSRSAMLPIVNESIEAERVAIYNQNVQAKHPL